MMAMVGCTGQREPAPPQDSASARSLTVSSFTGVFRIETRVQATLYLVGHGASQRICNHTMMRSPNVEPVAPVENLELTLLLTNTVPKRGKTEYLLFSMGSSRSATSDPGRTYPTVGRAYKKLLEGDIFQSIPQNQEAICFAKGDSPFEAQWGMTPGEFARRNKGNFILVTLKWYN
jgi:hypothetical protein